MEHVTHEADTRPEVTTLNELIREAMLDAGMRDLQLGASVLLDWVELMRKDGLEVPAGRYVTVEDSETKDVLRFYGSTDRFKNGIIRLETSEFVVTVRPIDKSKQ